MKNLNKEEINNIFQRIKARRKILDMPTATVQWKYYKAVHTLRISISNLTMFIITFILYIESKNRIEEKTDVTNITNNTKQDNYQSIDSITPSSIDGIATESTTASKQTALFSNKIEMSLSSISAIFLALTIFLELFLQNTNKKDITNRLNNIGS